MTVITQTIITVILAPVGESSEMMIHQTTFSRAVFQNILNHWGPEKIQIFLTHYNVDTFHPIIYSTFLASCAYKVLPRNYIGNIFVSLSFLAGFFDEVENICQYSLTSGWLSVDSIWFYVGAGSARLKWCLIALVVVVLLATLVKNQFSKKEI